MSTLNPQQQQAVEHMEGPALVIAGAGAGKTRIVTQRIARLLDLGVPASDIIAVTFTNKAAQEMSERVAHMTSQRVLISTFHSLGARILRESIEALGYNGDFTIYDEEDALKLIKECLVELGVKGQDIKPKIFKAMISDAKNKLQKPDEIDPSTLMSAKEQAFPSVYGLYQTKLRQYNACDFDDLLFMTVRLFEEHPDVLLTYQKRWSFVLIDEYQDINKAQYMMATLLVKSSQNIFVVGDPDQSIYSWRGANIENILNFERDYPGAKIIRLEQNYRSTNTILEASNAVIQNNESRYDKNLWSDKGAGESIKLVSCDSDREEAEFVAEKIRDSALPLNEMVIFYRTNFQSRVFEDALLRYRIPYVIVGGMSFYQRREIKDILSFLRMVESGTDMLAFSRTINIPKRGVGDTTMEKLRQTANAQSMPIFDFCHELVATGSDEVKLSKKQLAGLDEYVRIIRELRAAKQEVPLWDLVSQAIRKTGYLDYLKLDEETFEDRKGNLEELVSKAAEWADMNEEPTLQGFLEELSLKSSADDTPTDEKVRLMTLHNGKGLEFELVFLVGMEEGLFPHINSISSSEQIEEERRLCYVGMTRSKNLLYICSSRYRFLWGQPQVMRPSRFLKEIPSKYTQTIDPQGFAPIEEDEPPEPTTRFEEGEHIVHKDFGRGIIQEAYEGSLGLIYKIAFQRDRTIKTIVAKYAKLSRAG